MFMPSMVISYSVACLKCKKPFMCSFEVGTKDPEVSCPYCAILNKVLPHGRVHLVYLAPKEPQKTKCTCQDCSCGFFVQHINAVWTEMTDTPQKCVFCFQGIHRVMTEPPPRPKVWVPAHKEQEYLAGKTSVQKTSFKEKLFRVFHFLLHLE